MVALKNKDVKLLVAGEFYSDSKPYFDLIQKHGLEDKVIIHQKFVPDPEVKYYFGLADLIVQPYKTATQSGVTQIGYHFEKPMLVTNVGGLSEIIPHGKVGFVVEPESNDIANSIAEFYDKNLAETFHKHILAEKEKYAWSKMTKAILDLHKQV